MIPRDGELVVVPAQDSAAQNDASVHRAVLAQPRIQGVGVLDGALAQLVVARARRRSPRTRRNGAIDRAALWWCGCDSPVGTYEDVGFVRREKDNIHLRSHANASTAANGRHDRPSLSWSAASQSPSICYAEDRIRSLVG